MSDANPPGLRILIGAGSYADAAAALRIVERLTDTFRAGLGGILVEEETLNICQIPNQRVIQASGMTTLAPSLAQIRTLVRADARAFRQSLAHAANLKGTHWVFAQDQGDLVQVSLHAAAGWDVLIIGYRQAHKLRGKIVQLRAATLNADMDEVSNQLSDQLSAECVVFSIKTETNTAKLTSTSDAVLFDTLGESLKALTRMNVEAVLVDLRQGPVQNQSDLARVLEAARCPVIVFGASSIEAQLEHSTHIPPVSSP